VVVPEPLDGPVDPAVLLEEALQAISNFDDRGLESTLDKALLHLSKPLLRKELISPLLNEVGERWSDGRLRISQEHMATAIVSAFLSAINTRYQVLPGAPLVTVATPSGHFHELGALLAAANAYEAGWDVLYLGPNIPAEEIALAAQSRGVRAVMLSLIFPGGDPAVATQLRELRRLVGPAMPIIAGGQAVPSYQGVLAEIGAITVVSTEQLGAALGSI
jgi:methanogenic corrinoid protein MtbC1